VQNVAGHALLGSAAASVQLSRSIGASVGTALVGAVLFATLALGEAGTTEVFGRLLQEGPSALASLPAARHAALQAGIANAFRHAFLAIAAFAALGGALAWTIPTRRL
jgi:hypothetical protein